MPIERIRRTHHSLEMIRARPLAELLGVHEITIWNWLRQGRLPKPIRIGRNTTCWRRADIETWLAQQEQQPRPARDVSARKRARSVS